MACRAAGGLGVQKFCSSAHNCPQRRATQFAQAAQLYNGLVGFQPPEVFPQEGPAETHATAQADAFPGISGLPDYASADHLKSAYPQPNTWLQRAPQRDASLSRAATKAEATIASAKRLMYPLTQMLTQPAVSQKTDASLRVAAAELEARKPRAAVAVGRSHSDLLDRQQAGTAEAAVIASNCIAALRCDEAFEDEGLDEDIMPVPLPAAATVKSIGVGAKHAAPASYFETQAALSSDRPAVPEADRVSSERVGLPVRDPSQMEVDGASRDFSLTQKRARVSGLRFDGGHAVDRGKRLKRDPSSPKASHPGDQARTSLGPQAKGGHSGHETQTQQQQACHQCSCRASWHHNSASWPAWQRSWTCSS